MECFYTFLPSLCQVRGGTATQARFSTPLVNHCFNPLAQALMSQGAKYAILDRNLSRQIRISAGLEPIGGTCTATECGLTLLRTSKLIP
jgi:hypothetical protein